MTDEDRKLDRKVAKAGAWEFGFSLSNQIIAFAVFALLARLLGPEAYGVVAIALLAVAFAENFIGEYVTDAIVQRKELEKGHIDAMFVLQIGGGLALALIAWAAAGPIAAGFNMPQVAVLMPALGVAIVLQALAATPAALLMRDLRFDLLAIRALCGVVAGGTVGIAMALNGFGAWSLVGQQITQRGVAFLVLALTSDWRPGVSCRARHFREVIGMTLRLIATRWLIFFELQAPKILIGLTGGAAAVGLFNMGWRLVETVRTAFLGPLVNVTFPVIAQLQSEPERLRGSVKFGTRMSALIGCPAYLGMAAVAPVLVPFAFGEAWIEAVPVLQVFCLLGVVWSLTNLELSIYRGLGRHDLTVRLSVISVVMLVILLATLGRYGAVAGAAVILIRNLLIWPISLRYLSRITPIKAHQFVLFSAPVLGSALAMAVVSAAAASFLPMVGWPDWASLIAAVGLGLAAYPAALFVLARGVLRDGLAKVKELRGRGADAAGEAAPTGA